MSLDLGAVKSSRDRYTTGRACVKDTGKKTSGRPIQGAVGPQEGPIGFGFRQGGGKFDRNGMDGTEVCGKRI